MRTSRLLCFAGIVGVLALMPGPVAAQGRLVLNDGGMMRGPGHVVVRPGPPRPVHHPFFRYPVGPYSPYAFSAPPAYGYMPPYAVYDQPSPMVIVSPAPPYPTPSVIEYPNGRYELRGDGYTTPYRWVWIPKAPPPPPEPPPADRPDGAPPARSEPARERQPAPYREIYRWSDPDGVTHWTDQLENIPERQRSNAQRPALAGR